MEGDKRDDDAQALRKFLEFKNDYVINYKRINDNDVLVDAMSEASGLEVKKLLLRYCRLKKEAEDRDKPFVMRICKNYFSCVRKAGLVMKRFEASWLGTWEYRFVVLTNAGFIYFKSKQLLTDQDLVPKNFKPLNDFVVQEVEPRVGYSVCA